MGAEEGANTKDKAAKQMCDLAEELDLDDEERAALAEVSKKGYYHGRPRSITTPAPQRLQSTSTACTDWDGGSKDVPSSSTEQFLPQKQDEGDLKKEVRRAEFDEFQKKWDKFDRDDFIEDMCERDPRAKQPETPEREFLGPSSLPLLGNALQNQQQLLSSM